MEPRRVTHQTLDKLMKGLKEGKEEVIGNYLYKGFRVQISRYKLSTSDRVMQLYKRRRREGLCIQCGKKVTKKNPRTKKLYRLCDYHRKKIDNK